LKKETNDKKDNKEYEDLNEKQEEQEMIANEDFPEE
jgi:hypothetical protein